MDKDENTSNNNDKNNEKQQQLKEQLVQVDPNVTTKKKDGNTEDDNQVNETFNVSPKIEEKQENKDNLNDNGGNVSLLKAREDDKVSPQDHRKCEEAFKAANIDNLDDTQASNIYKYEYNLIKMARRDKESSVINIATEKCGLGETDADLLATELIDRFGKSQSNGSGDDSKQVDMKVVLEKLDKINEKLDILEKESKLQQNYRQNLKELGNQSDVTSTSRDMGGFKEIVRNGYGFEEVRCQVSGRKEESNFSSKWHTDIVPTLQSSGSNKTNGGYPVATQQHEVYVFYQWYKGKQESIYVLPRYEIVGAHFIREKNNHAQIYMNYYSTKFLINSCLNGGLMCKIYEVMYDLNMITFVPADPKNSKSREYRLFVLYRRNKMNEKQDSKNNLQNDSQYGNKLSNKNRNQSNKYGNSYTSSKSSNYKSKRGNKSKRYRKKNDTSNTGSIASSKTSSEASNDRVSEMKEVDPTNNNDNKMHHFDRIGSTFKSIETPYHVVTPLSSSNVNKCEYWFGEDAILELYKLDGVAIKFFNSSVRPYSRVLKFHLDESLKIGEIKGWLSLHDIMYLKSVAQVIDISDDDNSIGTVSSGVNNQLPNITATTTVTNTNTNDK